VINFRKFLEDLPLVPTVTKKGIIRTLDRNKNPIFVQLSDGTQLYFTWDEFKRINGKPEMGKHMTVTMQRHPMDFGSNPSQIQKITVD
jgi:hypothetical protein